jgi:hypothetical protein
MNRKGFVPWNVIWFLIIILVAGILTMVYLPSLLNGWFGWGTGVTGTIGVILLLAILGLLKFMGAI